MKKTIIVGKETSKRRMSEGRMLGTGFLILTVLISCTDANGLGSKESTKITQSNPSWDQTIANVWRRLEEVQNDDEGVNDDSYGDDTNGDDTYGDDNGDDNAEEEDEEVEQTDDAYNNWSGGDAYDDDKQSDDVWLQFEQGVDSMESAVETDLADMFYTSPSEWSTEHWIVFACMVIFVVVVGIVWCMTCVFPSYCVWCDCTEREPLLVTDQEDFGYTSYEETDDEGFTTDEEALPPAIVYEHKSKAEPVQVVGGTIA